MILGHLLAHALGQTRAGQFFNMAMALLAIAALPILAVVGLSVFTWKEVAKETAYHQKYGDQWKTLYEEEQGSLSEARSRIVVAALGTLVIGSLGAWLYWQFIPALRGEGTSPRSYRHHRRRRRRS